MPRPKNNDHLLELAKRGAQARLNDLVHEVRMLIGLFPHLKDSVSKEVLPVSFLLKRSARDKTLGSAAADGAEPTEKKTRNLSPAARRAISNAQKKRWAAHRAATTAAKKA